MSVSLNSPKSFPRIAVTDSDADNDKLLQHVASIKNQNITSISFFADEFTFLKVSGIKFKKT